MGKISIEICTFSGLNGIDALDAFDPTDTIDTMDTFCNNFTIENDRFILLRPVLY